MKLSFRTKTYGSIITLLLVFFAALCLYLWYTGNRSAMDVQYEDAQEKLALLNRLLENELENQVIKQADWARWDDTYQFVSDRNDSYILSNLNDESFESIEINMMAFVNNAGELVYGKQVYSQAFGEQSIPEEFLHSFIGKNTLLDFDERVLVRKGVLVTPEHTLLVTSQPITTSDGKGSRRGTLIFARYADSQYVDTLSHLSGMKVMLSPYGFAGSAMESGVLSRNVPMIDVRDDAVRGRLLVDNIFGNPSLVLGIDYPAAIVEDSRSSSGQTLGRIFPGFLFYLGVLLLCVEVFLVRPIEKIRQVVRRVNSLHLGGAKESDLDDFSYLAGVMTGAVEKIKQSDDLTDVTWDEIAKYRLALDQSFDCVIITDNEGKILYSNLAAEKMTGYSRVEMQGKTPSLWGQQMPKEFYVTFWETIRLKKKVFEGTVTNRHKNGQAYQANIRVTPVLDDKKRVLYFIGTERPTQC